MSKVNTSQFLSDDDWSEDASEQSDARRTHVREKPSDIGSNDNFWDENIDDEYVRGRKPRVRRRDIEDRLEKRRLRREIYDDYDDFN